jgi:hypothetical protein
MSVVPPLVAAEKVRLCLLAARLRTRKMKYTDIAAELGFANAAAAKRAVSVGLGLMPAENFAEARRQASEELDEMTRGVWEEIENPPPMTTVSGKIVINPETGQPYPDAVVRIQARRLLLDIQKEWRKLHGVDAPKQSVTFSGTLEDLRAEVEKKQAELAALEQNTHDGPGGSVTTLPGQVSGQVSGGNP